MKTTLKIFAAIVMIAGFTTTMMAQNTPVGPTTGPTSVGAKIVQALTISETSALHFGTMTIPTADVDVILSTTNGRTATAAVLTLLPQSPFSTNAYYTVAGSADATYTINLPGNGTITISTTTTGATPMDVQNFVARADSKTVDGTTGTLDGSGNDKFKVGATLSLKSGQVYGIYAGTFPVTVAYN